MSHRRHIFAALLLAGTLVIYLLGRPKPPVPPPPGETVVSVHPAAPAPASRPSNAPAPGSGLPTPAAAAARPATPMPMAAAAAGQPTTPEAAKPRDASAGMVAAEKVRHMVSDYHTLMGENPVGTNAEIMRALMGGNPRQATLGPPEGQTLNGAGELVDPWGHPYFFHQLSKDEMEIHSAGPDGVMDTDDDVIQR